MARDARLIIGHCRYATHGDPDVNLNNHPHDGGDSWVVHNGVIHHYRELVIRHRLRMHTECDSEVLGLMLQRFRGKPDTRMMRVLGEAVADNPFAMMALWPDRLLAVRANGQPLHQGHSREGYYIGSLARGLPGLVEEFPEGGVIQYD
jgi:glucosamine 6-phosphate synthetase-like amidotransferase/phosphosugar isomerase protein